MKKRVARLKKKMRIDLIPITPKKMIRGLSVLKSSMTVQKRAHCSFKLKYAECLKDSSPIRLYAKGHSVCAETKDNQRVHFNDNYLVRYNSILQPYQIVRLTIRTILSPLRHYSATPSKFPTELQSFSLPVPTSLNERTLVDKIKKYRQQS